jgi:hypothetical protein
MPDNKEKDTHDEHVHLVGPVQCPAADPMEDYVRQQEAQAQDEEDEAHQKGHAGNRPIDGPSALFPGRVR